MVKQKGKIIAVSSPSGGGKTTIVRNVLDEFPEIVFSVSATTRPKRENEVEGKHYYFITENEFLKKIENNEFIEWERFYDYYYGTLKSFVNDNIEDGKHVLLEVDVKGALSLKKLFPDASLIFIDPPGFEELVDRLKNRKTENEEDFRKRVERAKMELSHKDDFDYLIRNDDLEKAIEEAKSLIRNIIKKEND